jgi:hypothetical protein
MKAKHLLLPVIIILLIASGLMAQNVWINEVHYDNTGTDADEFIEVVLENPGSYSLADFAITGQPMTPARWIISQPGRPWGILSFTGSIILQQAEASRTELPTEWQSHTRVS